METKFKITFDEFNLKLFEQYLPEKLTKKETKYYKELLYNAWYEVVHRKVQKIGLNTQDYIDAIDRKSTI